MNTIRTFHNAFLTTSFTAALSAAALTSFAALNPNTQELAQKTLQKGLAWLQTNQKDDGSWSAPGFPGLSALGLWAAAASSNPALAPTIAKGADFVASFAQPDGGIYQPADPTRRGSGGLSTYNTAICMMALYQVDPQKYAPIILKAREFVASSQLVGGSGGPDAPEAGGFGYNKPLSEAERAALPPSPQGRPRPAERPDLSNTGWALMAMRMTESLEDQRPAGQKRADIQWDAALQYLTSMQNTDPSNPDSLGSFGYERSGEREGKTTPSQPGAKVALRGFGSMTYDGLEAMIYAKVDRKDPRVRSAAAWAAQHWTVEENPGAGQKGLFYYYTILAKSLNAFTQGAEFTTQDGTPIDWQGDLIRKLAATQHPDGSWSNDDNTFWENDPALVTAYSLLTLEYACENTAK